MGEEALARDERRDVSWDGIAFRELIDDILSRLAGFGDALTEDHLAEIGDVIGSGIGRFDHDRERVHQLNQILSVLALLEGNADWPEAQKMVLSVVRGQRA